VQYSHWVVRHSGAVHVLEVATAVREVNTLLFRFVTSEVRCSIRGIAGDLVDYFVTGEVRSGIRGIASDLVD